MAQKTEILAPADPERKKRLGHWRKRLNEMHRGMAQRAGGREIDLAQLDEHIESGRKESAEGDNSDAPPLGRIRPAHSDRA